MGFFDAVKSVYSNYFQFKGRARRSEYWWFQLFGILMAILLYGGGSILAVSEQEAIAGILIIAYVLFALGSFFPALAVLVRRLHDTGRSGWWCFITFIPLVGPIILLIFLIGDSKPGANEHGPNPKESITKVFE